MSDTVDVIELKEDATVVEVYDGVYAGNVTSQPGSVNSVFGRSGAVVAQVGDYSAIQVGAEPANGLLSAIASLSANGFIERTGSASVEAVTVSAFAKSLLDDVDVAAARVTLGLAVVASSGNYNDLADVPSLAAVAISGDYGDLAGAPSFSSIATSGDYGDLSNTPALATVATTGAYADLLGVPTLSAVATSGDYGDLLNQPSLATVAISGNYSDLLGSPSLSSVATTGDYSDLLNVPALATVATTGSYTDLANSPSLASVATTGNYNELNNLPDLSALNNVSSHINLATFPVAGISSTVYIAEDTGYMYRWNGSGYTQLTDQTAIWGQVSGTLSNQTDLLTELNNRDTANRDRGSHAGTQQLSTISAIAANSLVGNNSGSSATPSALTVNQVRSLLSLIVGVDIQAYSSLLAEIVSGFGAANNGDVLRKDGANLAYQSASSSSTVVTRQSVQDCPKNVDGYADWLTIGSGLTVNSSGISATTPLILSWVDDPANGNPQDLIIQETTNALSWGGLTANNVNYLYVDNSSGSLVAGTTTLEPVYGMIKPTSPSVGQFFYDIRHVGPAEVWDGSTWQKTHRLYVGEAETDGISVTNVISYAIQGFYFRSISGLQLNTAISYATNIGVALTSYQLHLICIAAEDGYTVGSRVKFNSVGDGNTGTGSIYRGVAAENLKNQFRWRGSGSLGVVGFNGNAPGLSLANWNMELIVKRIF